MKRYKAYFSFWNLFHETQAEVVRLQTYFKAVTITAASIIYTETDLETAKWPAIIGLAIDIALGMLWVEQVKKNINDAD